MSEYSQEDDSDHQACVATLLAEGKGDRLIAQELGITRHQARNLIREAERANPAPLAAAPVSDVVPWTGEGLEFHPLADLFPLIEGTEFVDMVSSIKANGLRHPVVLFEGKILDGRNRYRACLAADVVPQVEQFSGDDPIAFVVDENLTRRHLNESQRAMVAADMSRLTQGARTDLSPRGEMSQAERASVVGVGKRTVERADVVTDKGVPELAAAVRKGTISVNVAERVAQLDPDEQTRIVAKPERAATEVKKATRKAREVDLGEKQAALPDKKYGVILADPEWKFEVWSEGGMDRAADNHYPTSATDIIAARDVASIAADDCVLFLWATAPMLPQALAVMSAWGFQYASHIAWDKQIAGTGYWSRNRHELMLIGTRGNVPAPAPGTQCDSIIVEKRGRHSVKPEESYRIIEAYFPNLPKIELNARQARPGWDSWGNEAPAQTEAAE